MLEHKKIIIGVCGGIAAYKAVSIVSTLVKNNNHVTVVMTEAATRLVHPNTFRTISRNPVITDLFAGSRDPVPHISLSDEYEALVIVPATANILGKAAHGIADDALSTLIVSFGGPVLFAPAMNTGMWDNPVVRNNVSILRKYGYSFVEPAYGILACGTSGAGRLPGEEAILGAIESLFHSQDLAGKKILITAGGTRERIDSVRMITNASTGKMGVALAKEALLRGAEVVLVTTVPVPQLPGMVTVIPVDSAQEMLAAVEEHFSSSTVFISAAAVADFRVADPVEGKIKKDSLQGGELTLRLIPNPDIVKLMGSRKKPGQLVVGFSLEARDLLANARKKLQTKNLDMIIANSPAAIGADATEVTIVIPSGETRYTGNKSVLAKNILDSIIK